jgi:hypothetical protein
MEVTAGTAAVIAAVVGGALFAIGVIPIGILAVVGIGMLIAIVKAAVRSKPPGD